MPTQAQSGVHRKSRSRQASRARKWLKWKKNSPLEGFTRGPLKCENLNFLEARAANGLDRRREGSCLHNVATKQASPDITAFKAEKSNIAVVVVVRAGNLSQINKGRTPRTTVSFATRLRQSACMAWHVRQKKKRDENVSRVSFPGFPKSCRMYLPLASIYPVYLQKYSQQAGYVTREVQCK